MGDPEVDDLGVLTQAGDDVVLTFTRRFDHPAEKVWRAVTEEEHLATWFPQKINCEWRAGAPLRFESEGGDGFEGEVVAFDPPSMLEVMWGTDRLRIEVRPDGNGTVLTLVDTFVELGKAARDAAGWHECLDRLEHHLDAAPLGKWGADWLELFDRYKQALGPDASTIGPPEGWQAEV